MENDTVAILIDVNVFKALTQYLGEQPFNQVAGFFEALGKSPGLTQEHIDKLQEDEEAPE